MGDKTKGLIVSLLVGIFSIILVFLAIVGFWGIFAERPKWFIWIGGITIGLMQFLVLGNKLN